MALRLKIVSENAADAGDNPRWTFGVNGGRIGRHTSNDWVLRDPDRYVSGRHAEIEHRGGTWLLRDTSTNGTFVNDSDEALGPDRLHSLTNGDRFRIGEYEIEVEITGGNDFPAQEAAAVSDADLQASFEVKSFISTGRRERDALAGRPRAEPLQRPAPAPQASPQAAPQAPSSRGREDQEQWPGLVALCRGAGIDPLALPAKCAARHCIRRASCCVKRSSASLNLRARVPTSRANSEFHPARGAAMQPAHSPESRRSSRSWSSCWQAAGLAKRGQLTRSAAVCARAQSRECDDRSAP